MNPAAPDLGGVMRVYAEVPHVRICPSVVLVPAINVNQPATFVHWSIFDVTVANLVLIAVMVAIFGAALLLPFPKGRLVEAAAVADPAADPAITGAAGLPDDTAGLWTARLRRRALRTLPPGKLLPDSQPAYVA